MSSNEQWNDGPASPKGPQKSQALPFMNSPATLDGSFAGDRGFDPLGFAESKGRLTFFREAEIKHARLAMLAAAGWPLSELWDKNIATMLDLPPIVDATNRAPSVLNGGLGKISPAYWVGCLALAAAVEAYGGIVASKKSGYQPGELGFDPFGLYPTDRNEQKNMQLSEIKHGRLAMIAITAFAAQEFVAHTAVVDHAGIFFRPLTHFLTEKEFPFLYVADTVEQAQTAANEAASMIASPPVNDAVSAIATPAVDAITAAPLEAAVTAVPPVADVVAATPPVEVAAAPSAELIAARERIAELEAKLSKIAEFSR